MPEVEIKAQQVVFPPICPICSMPATHLTTMSGFMGIPEVFSQSVKLPVPFCEYHHALCTRSDLMIRRLTRLWVVGVTLSAGALVILVRLALSVFSMSRLHPGVYLELIMLTCGAIAIGLFAALYLVPIIEPLMHYFDPPETKAMRKAFRIKSFNVEPGIGLTRVNFFADNPKYAEALAQANSVRVIN